MEVGLFFGSFNPVHTGHLIIANYMAYYTDLQQVWLVVSPHNPHKEKRSLANDYDRLHLVRLAVEGNERLKASDIEFRLPQPSYTVDTLAYLKEQYPQHRFSVIMGGDNLATLHRWKNYEHLLEHYGVYVYRRPGSVLPDVLLDRYPNIRVPAVPALDISATFVRQAIKRGLSVRYLVPDSVLQEIERSGLYRG